MSKKFAIEQWILAGALVFSDKPLNSNEPVFLILSLSVFLLFFYLFIFNSIPPKVNLALHCLY